MSKYCQNCGTQMDDNAMFCSNCGFKVVDFTENQQQVQQNQTQQQVQGINYNQGYYQQQNANLVPKKKSKKKPIIISVVAVVLAAILAFGGFTLYGKFFNNKTVDECGVINKDGKNIYFGYQPFELGSDGSSISTIDIVGVREDIQDIGIPRRSTYDGDTIYYISEGDLLKMTYDKGKFKSSIWVDTDVISNNDTLSSKENDNLHNIDNLKYADGYAYFNTIAVSTYLKDSYSRANRMGRISKDGKTIEMLSDSIHATNYTIYDGWIYYFDNGFEYSSDKIYDSANDFSQERVGIYRAKIDGSNIEKLYSNQYDNNENMNDMAFSGNALCSNIKIVDNYIYFIDRSKNGQGKICRIDKDGSNYLVISDNSATSYTINEEDNVLYYVLDTSFSKVYEKKIDDSSKDKELMKCITTDSWLQYYDNCLYLFYYGFNRENAGQRYNFEKGKMEIIHDTQSQKDYFVDDNGGHYTYKETTPKYEWVNDY